MVAEKFYTTSNVLQSHIENTIRVFKDYKLSKRPPKEGWLRVWENAFYYDYTFAGLENEIELQVEAGKAAAKIDEITADNYARSFIANIKKIAEKEIVITPEIANVDPYKPVNTRAAIMQLILLIIALIATFYGIKAFMM